MLRDVSTATTSAASAGRLSVRKSAGRSTASNNTTPASNLSAITADIMNFTTQRSHITWGPSGSAVPCLTAMDRTSKLLGGLALVISALLAIAIFVATRSDNPESATESADESPPASSSTVPFTADDFQTTTAVPVADAALVDQFVGTTWLVTTTSLDRGFEGPRSLSFVRGDPLDIAFRDECAEGLVSLAAMGREQFGVSVIAADIDDGCDSPLVAFFEEIGSFMLYDLRDWDGAADLAISGNVSLTADHVQSESDHGS